MSYNLWKYFFNDDVDGFRQYVAKATFDRNASRGISGTNTVSVFKVGSPGHVATSPKTPLKPRKSVGNVSITPGRSNVVVLTRSDVNARDDHGRTLLHHAVSLPNATALQFVKILLEIPLLDLYVQDTESGWTALHRALYLGNIAAAQALMLKDIQNATDYTTNISHANAGGLVKIKDHEGNSPFEVFGLTTAPRDLQQQSSNLILDGADFASVQSFEADDSQSGLGKLRELLKPVVDLKGDDIFAFGSNKNITLGLGDGDDRTFPERVLLRRPGHLLQHLLEDFQNERQGTLGTGDLSQSLAQLGQIPSVINHKPIVIQDVVMSKLHTAVLTTDPISNLHICGFGPGGRLGSGDESTRFTFSCIQGGGLAKRCVASIALGQDHSVAVCSSGEVFTWGSNKYGQLGYELPEITGQDVPTQLTPRQIYGLIKKEQIIGAAASSLHSAIFTSSGLYTFGKNEGQLGLMDADARSLETQVLPRRVGVSVLQYAIESVAAIDRATTVLLENHDVIVFTHYGWTKLSPDLDSFGSSIASDAFFARHNRQTKHICRITSGGNTICALSSYGEVFTVDVPRHLESGPSNKSTTNPNKARNALPKPTKVWSIRKAHMAATDAAAGQDGSVLLCTAAGTVWRKEKRANIKSVHADMSKNARPKDYKFVRVPNIFSAVAVRSNSFGAYTAIRKDCDVMKQQIVVEAPGLWDNMFDLLAFREYGASPDEEAEDEPQLRFWKPALKAPCPALIKRALLINANAEDDFMHVAARHEPLSSSDYDVWICSNVTEVKLPVHSLVLKARSKVLRSALAQFMETYYFTIPDVLSIEYGPDGQVRMQLNGADFLTLVNFVLYLYTDTLADVWRYTSKALHLAPRYRSVRTELMKIATALEMKQLERAVRVMDEPTRCLRNDFDIAFADSDLFSDADVIIDLANGEERYAHSVMLQARCPFFEGLFYGHTGGMWMSNRRKEGEESLEPIRVDLKHIDADHFELVLRHIYADSADELFDTIVTQDLDNFIDLVIEVMAIANELMLGRLAHICQSAIGRYVTPWNVCGLLNTIAESSEEGFKHAGLEYVGLNLEHMLEQRLLEELDEYLLEELNEVVQSNQLAFMPIARSNRILEVLLERDPTLAEHIETSRKRRLDSMRLPSRYVMEPYRPSNASRTFSISRDKSAAETSNIKRTLSDREKASPLASPRVSSGIMQEDLPFEMDDDRPGQENSYDHPSTSPSLTPMAAKGSRMSSTRLSSSHGSQLGLDSESEPPSLATTPHVGNIASSAAETGQSSRAAWNRPLTDIPRLDLRDIMLQDSSNKISSLTQSLKQASLSKQSTAKVSQKGRKRQQHERKLQEQAQVAASAEQKAKEVEQAKPGQPQSPWQKVTPKPPSTASPAQQSAPPQCSQSASSTSQAEPVKQQARNKKPRGKEGKPEPSRSVSAPGMTGASNAPPPQIQSIRHTPAPVRSTSWLDARTSMADILAQQQIEKIAITDSTDKRSLQEIQEEQEFQAWWDNESRRVQEEEAAASAAAARLAKGRGGRGRGGAREESLIGETQSPAKTLQRRRDLRKSAQTLSKQQEDAQPRVESSDAPSRRQNRSRGGSRGRGRGQ